MYGQIDSSQLHDLNLQAQRAATSCTGHLGFSLQSRRSAGRAYLRFAAKFDLTRVTAEGLARRITQLDRPRGAGIVVVPTAAAVAVERVAHVRLGDSDRGCATAGGVAHVDLAGVDPRLPFGRGRNVEITRGSGAAD